MKSEDRMRKVQEGYQPRKDELTRGYQVKQPVDPEKLKIPTNLADAAVIPGRTDNHAATPAKSKNQ